MRHWDIGEAEGHWTEIVHDAVKSGPQEISINGNAAVVIVSVAEFERLKKPRQSFVDFMMASPLVGADINLDRDRGEDRAIDL